MKYEVGQTVTVRGQIMTVEEIFSFSPAGNVYFLTNGDGESDWFDEVEID